MITSTASVRQRHPMWARSHDETGRRGSSPVSQLSFDSFPTQLFVSPPAAGRKITAGFSYVQRIGKSGTADVWFPEKLRAELDALIASGTKLGPEHFPAEWAAVRQFELLHESGNYKLYDMKTDYITRTLRDLSSHMRAGGYCITVASLGRYVEPKDSDDLQILDKRLQDRIAKLIHMMYLDEQSEAINHAMDEALAAEEWDFQTALPHLGANMGARDLFRPVANPFQRAEETYVVPMAPHRISAAYANGWLDDLGVTDTMTGYPFARVDGIPGSGQYQVKAGHYLFASADTGREVTLHYSYHVTDTDKPTKLSAADRKHKLARHFFDIVNQLPQKHIVHDTAIGLQLPESINEHEWIYCAQSEDTLFAFNSLLSDVFRPFDGMSLSRLDGRADAKSEVKATTQHMRGYGDRLNAEADQYYRNLARFAM